MEEGDSKILELDEFVQVECDIHYEEFVEQVKGVELSRLLRQGTSTQVPTTDASPAPRL